MKPVLVTGALGSVGIPTVESLITSEVPVRILDLPTAANKRIHRKKIPEAETVWGDIRDPDICQQAVKGCRAVIHLAAIIPPQADRNPERAREVNVGGTANIVAAVAGNQQCRLIFSSSVAVYGDRVNKPYIRVDDPLNPGTDDHYARQKMEAEKLIRESGIKWTIFRLSYIAVAETLKFNPLMFAMPLKTSLEICDPRDAGKALASAVEDRDTDGKTFLLSGGEYCRTTYRDYLGRILRLLGLGIQPLPEKLFSSGNFHCGFMDSAETEKRYHFQRHTLTDFFDAVEKKCRCRRFFISLVRPLARRWLVSLSPLKN